VRFHSDVHPGDPDTPASRHRAASLGVRKAVNHQLAKHLEPEAVRQHDRLGAAFAIVAAGRDNGSISLHRRQADSERHVGVGSTLRPHGSRDIVHSKDRWRMIYWGFFFSPAMMGMIVVVALLHEF
jgi:hypothetical protein